MVNTQDTDPNASIATHGHLHKTVILGINVSGKFTELPGLQTPSFSRHFNITLLFQDVCRFHLRTSLPIPLRGKYFGSKGRSP